MQWFWHLQYLNWKSAGYWPSECGSYHMWLASCVSLLPRGRIRLQNARSNPKSYAIRRKSRRVPWRVLKNPSHYRSWFISTGPWWFASESFVYMGSSKLCNLRKTCDCRRCKMIQMPMRMWSHFITFFWILVSNVFQMTKSNFSHSLLQLHLNNMSVFSLEPSSTSSRPITCSKTGLQIVPFFRRRMRSLKKSTRKLERI